MVKKAKEEREKRETLRLEKVCNLFLIIRSKEFTNFSCREFYTTLGWNDYIFVFTED